MSRDGKISLTWADGDYSFRLAWGQLVELQEQTDAGPYVVLGRLQTGTWRVQDISSVIRLGLIGGGMSPTDALRLVRAYVEDRPPMENVLFAQAILSSSLQGAPEEPVGKKTDAASRGGKKRRSPTENSGSPRSTELAQ